MNINYLFSIITLYISNEKVAKTKLVITKLSNKKINFKFSMINHGVEATEFVLPLEIFVDENNLNTFMKMYKEDNIIIDENNNYDEKVNNCHYSVTFSNGRILSFHNFSLEETNNFRNHMFNIQYNKQEIRVLFAEEKKERKGTFRLRETGFMGITSTLLTIFLVLSLLFLGLWLYKMFIK